MFAEGLWWIDCGVEVLEDGAGLLDGGGRSIGADDDGVDRQVRELGGGHIGGGPGGVGHWCRRVDHATAEVRPDGHGVSAVWTVAERRGVDNLRTRDDEVTNRLREPLRLHIRWLDP